MSYPSIAFTYREAAVQQATPEALAITLLDILIDDLRQAADAMRTGEIERRSNALKHGFRVLGQLHAQIAPGTPAAEKLSVFYEYVRKRMLAAQFKPLPSAVQPLIPQILQVRSAFERVERQPKDVAAPETSEVGPPRSEHFPLSCLA